MIAMNQYAEVYSDFDVNLKMNRLTGDVVKKKNNDDIRQSLGLLLNTRFYDRKWHPEIGSYLPTLLFEQDDDFIKTVLKEQIMTLIENYEPRVTVESIEITHENLADVFHGKIIIRIHYIINIINVKDTYVFSANRLR